MHALLLAAVFIAPPTEDNGGATHAKASILNQLGKAPVTSAAFGEMLVFDGTKAVRGTNPDSIKWTVEPSQLAARMWQPIPNAFAITPEALDAEGTPYELWVLQSVALGDTTDHLLIRVRCGKGSLPPPKPVTPDVPKPVDPDTPKPVVIPKPDDTPLGLTAASYNGMKQVSSARLTDEAKAIANAYIDTCMEFAKVWPAKDPFAPQPKPYTLVRSDDPKTKTLESQLHARMATALDDAAKTRWKPWRDAVSAQFSAQEALGNITSAADVMAAYMEIAVGVAQP